jgi:magnesium-transporting ATPase (P-type)
MLTTICIFKINLFFPRLTSKAVHVMSWPRVLDAVEQALQPCGVGGRSAPRSLADIMQASLSWIKTVSPFAGYGSTLALTFVLLAAAIKAIIEDKKRQSEDHKTNNSRATVVVHENGHWVERETRWMHVKVGDIVKVRDNDLFPADLMCLHCNLPEHICYVKTTNLDGETNLKVKRCGAYPSE